MSIGDANDARAGDPSRRHDAGQLIVVGTGIQWASQTTLAAQRAMQLADQVLFAVADPWAARWIREQSPGAESFEYPRDGRARRHIYASMVERVLAALEGGRRVCAVFYGSAAVLTEPAHAAIRRARELGHVASMLPGVSFLDCLFADLGVDPGASGCHLFEATDFLVRRRPVDVFAPLVLCQVGLLGNRAAFDSAESTVIARALGLLARRLEQHYPPEHEVVLYEAASSPAAAPRVERLRLADLGGAKVSGISTLFVPALGRAPLDEEMLAALDGLRERR